MSKLTAEEYKWAQENVEKYKRTTFVGNDCVILLLKNGNMVIGKTIEEAVRMEMNKDGVLVEIGE